MIVVGTNLRLQVTMRKTRFMHPPQATQELPSDNCHLLFWTRLGDAPQVTLRNVVHCDVKRRVYPEVPLHFDEFGSYCRLLVLGKPAKR